MKFRGPGDRSAVVYREIAPHSAIRAEVDLPEHGVEDLAADVVEEDVDPVGTRLARAAPRRPPTCSRSHASKPSSSVIHAHFSGPPAMPTTRQPMILPICPATDPTAPAAPDTTTVSPSFGCATSNMPKYAVSPVTPSTLRNAVIGS